MTLLRFSDKGGRDKVCRQVSIPSTISVPRHRNTAEAAVAAHRSVPVHDHDVSSTRRSGGIEEDPVTDVCMGGDGDGQDGDKRNGADERGEDAGLRGYESETGKSLP